MILSENYFCLYLWLYAKRYWSTRVSNDFELSETQVLNK